MPYDMGAVQGDPVDWFKRALAWGSRVVGNVQAPQWGDPTPCSEWDVRQLVNHMVGNNIWYAGTMRGVETDDGPDREDLLGDDPVGAYERSMADAQAAMGTPGCMERVLPFWGGVTGQLFTAEHFVDCYIHAWDLAKATAQDTLMERDLVEAAYAILEPDNGQPPVDTVWDFADVFEDPAAELQSRLLARAGRIG